MTTSAKFHPFDKIKILCIFDFEAIYEFEKLYNVGPSTEVKIFGILPQETIRPFFKAF